MRTRFELVGAVAAVAAWLLGGCLPAYAQVAGSARPESAQPATVQLAQTPVAVASAPAVLGEWQRSRTLYHTGGSTQDAGGLSRDAVIIADTRCGAPPRAVPNQIRLAYTNVFMLRSEWERTPALAVNTWYAPTMLQFEQCCDAVVGIGRGSAALGYDTVRRLVDCRRPAARLMVRHEVQRIAAGGFDIAFWDNVVNTPLLRGQFDAPGFSDEDQRASIAAALETWNDECARLGRRIPVVINLADPLNWVEAGKPIDWKLGVERNIEFYRRLGAEGVMLEVPEKRAVGSTDDLGNIEFGTRWLAGGGKLFLIFQDAGKAAHLAAALDGPNTYVWLRR